MPAQQQSSHPFATFHIIFHSFNAFIAYHHCCGTGVLTGEEAGRRMFELLSTIAPTLAPDAEQQSVPSWCGATEAGLVGAAPPPGEGSHLRRKRRREAAGGEEGPVLGSVQWANPAAYKRAFR